PLGSPEVQYPESKLSEYPCDQLSSSSTNSPGANDSPCLCSEREEGGTSREPLTGGRGEGREGGASLGEASLDSPCRSTLVRGEAGSLAIACHSETETQMVAASSRVAP